MRKSLARFSLAVALIAALVTPAAAANSSGGLCTPLGLDATNSPADNLVLTYDAATGKFSWEAGGVSSPLNVDNLRLQTNTLSTTNANGDLILDPNGTGYILLPSGGGGQGRLRFELSNSTGNYGYVSMYSDSGTPVFEVDGGGGRIRGKGAQFSSSRIVIDEDRGGVKIGSTQRLGFSSGDNANDNPDDVSLARVAVNVVAVRNGSTGTGYIRDVPTDTPITCTAALVGISYFDTSLDERCDCKNNGGSPGWFQVDGGGAC